MALIHALLALFVGLPVHAGGPRVDVRAEDGLEKVAARMQARAEVDLSRIEDTLGDLPQVAHVEVRVVRHQEDIAAAAPGGRGAPPWAAGTAYPDEGVVVIALRGRDGALLDAERTLAHELAHMALDRALGTANVPRWLTEGFAYLHSSDASFARAETLLGAAVSGHIIPVEELDGAFPEREDAVALAYAEAYDFVAYLAERGGGAPFRGYLAELAHGVGPDEAARHAFGARLRDLEQEWLSSLRGRYLWLPLGALGLLVWVLGGVLLVLGWLRRRRRDRATLAQWARDEAHEDTLGEP